MYYFVCHIDTIAFHWQEKSTLLTNENKRIDHPRIKIVKCVGAKAQFFLLKAACGKSSSCRFSFPAARIAFTEATKYVSFGFFSFVFWFSSPPRKVWTSLSVAIRIFQCFSSHNPRKFRQTTADWELWRLCRSFINLTEWRERRVMCQQLISDIKHTWKNTLFFHVCCYGFSQG